ncbi:MAG: hypothetical protein IPI67_11565 [Myxococcales bacterium]|nr:hypothetical protein [Myxococcales bacterium]
MEMPDSTPEPVRRTVRGTIVGMPAVVRAPVRLGQLSSATLRSVYSREEGPCSDAFHPERWSTPPAAGLSPIIPCDEPEEDDQVQVRARSTTPGASAPERPPVELELQATGPTDRAAELPEPPTLRWQPPAAASPQQGYAPEPVASAPAEDPILLPFRSREPDANRPLLLLAGAVSAGVLLTLVTALCIWT